MIKTFSFVHVWPNNRSAALLIDEILNMIFGEVAILVMTLLFCEIKLLEVYI